MSHRSDIGIEGVVSKLCTSSWILERWDQEKYWDKWIFKKSLKRGITLCDIRERKQEFLDLKPKVMDCTE